MKIDKFSEKPEFFIISKYDFLNNLENIATQLKKEISEEIFHLLVTFMLQNRSKPVLKGICCI